jgi:neutral amino acid transport system substrate-binding protein
MNIKLNCISFQHKLAIVIALMTTVLGLTLTSCTDPNNSNKAPIKGLKIGSLLSSSGDLASIGQLLPVSVRMAVDTVNSCGGVNGEPVTLISEDDQSDPSAGAAVTLPIKWPTYES